MDSSMRSSMIAGAVVAVVAPLVVVVITLAFAWAWNMVMPLFWHSAPHLSFWQALAFGVLLGYAMGSLRFVLFDNPTGRE